MAAHLYREELSPDEFREQKIEAICNLQAAAFLVCTKTGLPVRYVAGRYILDLDECWCPDPHRIPTDDTDNPDAKRMRILNDCVLCPIHGTRYGIRAVMDKSLQGRRKSKKNKDEDLKKFNIHPKSTRYHGFQSGKDFGVTGLSADMHEAISQVHVSPKVDLRGVLIEVPTIRRAREVLETMSEDLPWKDLNEDIRDDLTLNADWHGAELTPQEKLALHNQQLETAVAARKARMKLINQMRSDADRLMLEKL